MRVFDRYIFNIAPEIPFKETKHAMDEMLGKLGYSYTDIALFMHSFTPCDDRLAKKYPVFEKYIQRFEYNGQTYVSGYSSLTDGWHDGQIHIGREDIPTVNEVLTKIPRPYNFETLAVLDNVNWFGDDTSFFPAILSDSSSREPSYSDLSPYFSNNIQLRRYLDFGSKFNSVTISVEATCIGGIRDTSHIAHRIGEYLGKEVFSRSRICILAESEVKRCKMLSEKLREQIKAFTAAEYHGVVSDSRSSGFSKGIISVAMLKAAFVPLGFQYGGSVSGTYTFTFYDENNHRHEVLISRRPLSDHIDILYRIMGYNFNIAVFSDNGYFHYTEHSKNFFAMAAEHIRMLQTRFTPRFYECFGKTPEWYGMCEDIL